jgi:hypothetical protein
MTILEAIGDVREVNNEMHHSIASRQEEIISGSYHQQGMASSADQSHAGSGDGINGTASTALSIGQIVQCFIYNYYNIMSLEPEELHLFYGATSYLSFGHERERYSKECYGPGQIHDHFMSFGLKGSNISINTLDFQPSRDGCILVNIVGDLICTRAVESKKSTCSKADSGGASKMLNSGSTSTLESKIPSTEAVKFVQTFILARQPNGYYVLNDCMRILHIPNIVQRFPNVSAAQTLSLFYTPTSSNSQENREKTEYYVDIDQKYSQSSDASHKKGKLEINNAELHSENQTSICHGEKIPNISTTQSEEKEQSIFKTEVCHASPRRSSESMSNSGLGLGLTAGITSWATIAASTKPTSTPSHTSSDGTQSNVHTNSYCVPNTPENTPIRASSVLPTIDQTTPISKRQNFFTSYSSTDKIPSDWAIAELNDKQIPPTQAPMASEEQNLTTKSTNPQQYGFGSAHADLSVFIKGIKVRMSAEDILPLLSVFGSVTYLDVVVDKSCAYANFSDSSGAKAAIGQTIQVKGCDLLIEKRQFRHASKHYFNRSAPHINTNISERNHYITHPSSPTHLDLSVADGFQYPSREAWRKRNHQHRYTKRPSMSHI